MNSSWTTGIRAATSMIALIVFLLCAHQHVRAQGQLISPSAPPPMKFIPSPDLSQLSSSQDAKSRVKSSILLAETRLLRAEQLTVDQRFIAATSELGIYEAIIENVLRYLGEQKADSNKTRDLYKRLEIQLRSHSTRIESMRRVTPAIYAVHVKAIWDFSDNARGQALNGFFNDTVVTDRSDTGVKTSAVEKPAAVPVTPSKKQP